jgi:hypothetical protein
MNIWVYLHLVCQQFFTARELALGFLNCKGRSNRVYNDKNVCKMPKAQTTPIYGRFYHDCFTGG